MAGGPSSIAPGQAGQIVEKTVDLAPAIVTAPPTSVLIGQPMRYAASAAGTPPFRWTLVDGPPGATLDAASGELFWTPPVEGVTAFELAVTNPLGSTHQRFVVAALSLPAITSSASTGGAVGQPWRYDDDGLPTASVLAGTALVAPCSALSASSCRQA